MKNDLRLKIEYLPPESLTPYEGNARVHEEYDINAIKQSITDTGFNDPIGIWGENNLIVEGHGRRIAAMELGLNSVPCIRLDHMTEEQRKEYALVHNKVAELSRWDFGKLEEELSTLKIDLSGFGFEVSKAFENYEPETAPEREDSTPYNYDEGFKDYQEPLSNDDLKQYEENADDYLLKRRVIITYLPEQEDAVKNMLGISGDIHVVYNMDDLIKGL